jgi:hypothetical protein
MNIKLSSSFVKAWPSETEIRSDLGRSTTTQTTLTNSI